MKYIIEHFEPELFEWCMIEYEHISKLVGSENLLFTNVKQKTPSLAALGKVSKESIHELKLPNACILDPEAKQTLSKQDSSFDYLILGGILGDDPPQKRTTQELSTKLSYPTRNLGKDQFATDTAVIVAQKLLLGTNLATIKFIAELEVETGDDESVILPFKYVVEGEKTLVSPKLLAYLKTHDGF